MLKSLHSCTTQITLRAVLTATAAAAAEVKCKYVHLENLTSAHRHLYAKVATLHMYSRDAKRCQVEVRIFFFRLPLWVLCEGEPPLRAAYQLLNLVNCRQVVFHTKLLRG